MLSAGAGVGAGVVVATGEKVVATGDAVDVTGDFEVGADVVGAWVTGTGVSSWTGAAVAIDVEGAGVGGARSVGSILIADIIRFSTMAVNAILYCPKLLAGKDPDSITTVLQPALANTS